MKLYLLVAVPAAVAAVYPLSDKGCQCKSACETSILNKYCQVDVSFCPDADKKSDGKDKCGHIFVDVLDGLDGFGQFFGDGAAELYDKIEGWSEENIQKIPVDEILKWGSDKLTLIPADKIIQMTKEQLNKLKIDELLKLGSKAGEIFESWPQLSSEQFDLITGAAKDKWDKIVLGIPADQIAKFGTDMAAKLPTEKLKAIYDKLGSLTLDDVKDFTLDQWKAVPVENLAKMGWKALQNFPLEEIAAWTEAQWDKIPVEKLIRLTGDQISKIPVDKIGKLSQEYWDKVPVNQIVKFNAALLKAAGSDIVKYVNVDKIAQLTADQWKALPVEELVNLSIDKLQAIDYTTIGSFTKEMWDKIPLEKMANLVGNQLEAIPTDAVAKWAATQWEALPTSKAVMFTKNQLVAGAAALKELTEEQLAKFDWGAVEASVRAQLPEDLQAKVTKIVADSVTGTQSVFKNLVKEAAMKKKAFVAAKLAYESVLNDATKTQDEVDVAEALVKSTESASASLEAQVARDGCLMDDLGGECPDAPVAPEVDGAGQLLLQPAAALSVIAVALLLSRDL